MVNKKRVGKKRVRGSKKVSEAIQIPGNSPNTTNSTQGSGAGVSAQSLGQVNRVSEPTYITLPERVVLRETRTIFSTGKVTNEVETFPTNTIKQYN